MPAFDNLKSASFDGVLFNVSRCNVRGGMRDHVHEFPHTPGGTPELMARRLYQAEMDASFSENTRGYLDAWSVTWPELRGKFERGTKGPLYIPTVGTITAYCVDWDSTFDARRRDGETTRFVFREWQDTEALVAATVGAAPVQVSSSLIILQLQIEEAELETDIFTAAIQAANEVIAIVDTVELQADLLASKVEQLASVVRQIDETASSLQDARNWRVAHALRNLGVAAVDLQRDTLRRSTPMWTYRVPTLMSISDVSRAMYRTADRAMELLLLNPVPDAFSIPPGFQMRGYVDLAQAA